MPPETGFAAVASTGAFDFTPAFEDAVLCIVPSALFLVVALECLFWLARQPRKLTKSHRPIVKPCCTGKPIMIDEASSNVDELSERLIRNVMREQFASSTVTAVAHRLGAAVDFDRVAVLGGGRLLEWDIPRAPLKRDSKFKRLWDLAAS
ncbi:hypothetical protein BDV11DRAFT_170996 [Aspergillus similis]